MNTKSLYAVITVFAFLIACVGFARFAVDMWKYVHVSSETGSVSAAGLNFGGLWAGLTLAAIAVVFLLLHLHKRH